MTAGIILCALLKVLILKEVVMPMPLQENLENHRTYPNIFLRNFKDINQDFTQVRDIFF